MLNGDNVQFCLTVTVDVQRVGLCLVKNSNSLTFYVFLSCPCPYQNVGAPVAQLVKRWSTDLPDRVRSSLEVKSSQP